MPESMGHQARFAIDDASPFDAGSYRFEALSSTLAKRTTVLDTSGIRGTRQHAKERVRFGLDDVSGTIVLNPSPLDLDRFLPFILGTAEAADVFDLAESPLLRDFLIDKGAGIFLYAGCACSRAVFRVIPSGLLELTIDVIGKTETGGQSWAGTIPALGTAAGDAPYVFSDSSTLTLGGNDRDASSIGGVTITIDHRARPRYTNSNTATDILYEDLIITLETQLEWSSSSPDNTDLYNAAFGGAAGTFTLVNGTKSLSFAFGNLQAEDRGQEIAGKGEIPFTLSMTARKSGTTAALQVTNDST